MPTVIFAIPEMKKVLFLFVIAIFCVLLVSISTQTFAKSKVTSGMDWSERIQTQEEEEEPAQDDNRDWDDETYRFITLFNFNNFSFNQDKLNSPFFFFVSTHFPEIDSPPPQG